MAKRFLTPINVLNAAFDPVVATEGDVYYNTTSEKLRIYVNSSWTDVSTNGVTSLSGTSNEIELSASAGAVQVGLPNEVRIESLSSGTASVDVSYSGNMFVTVSSYISSGETAYSTDGITWNPGTMPSARNWRTLSYGNNTFVSVASSSAAAATSTDGITWTASTMPSSQSWRGHSYGNNIFVAVASGSSAAATSTDGITWTARTMPSSQFWRIKYGNNIFIAYSAATTAAATSTDGITWNTGTLPSNQNWASISYGNNVFVAIAGRNISPGSSAAATSTDGITWTARTMPSSQFWFDIVYGNDIFVAVSMFGPSAVSTNGISWTQYTIPNGEWRSIIYGNNTFVTVSFFYNRSISSTDGVSWTMSTLPVEEEWESVTYGTPTTITSTPIASNLVPTQTGNSGKYLTTNGTVSSWGTIDLSGYQPLDGDLTSIAGLSGSAGFLRKTDLNTFTLDTSVYLTSEDISSKANLDSPALTGTPTAPTAIAGTDTTQIATTAFVNTATAAVQPTIHPMFIIGGV